MNTTAVVTVLLAAIYAVSIAAEPTLMTHTVYRPADLTPFTGGPRLPVVAWGNGACSNAGLLFQTFLSQIASHGFLVIASGPLDLSKVAVMGQSCGGLQATSVASDPRIKTVVIWNSGVFPENGDSPGRRLSGATKASLQKFHTPVAYFLGGPTDIAYANGKDDFTRLTTVPAFLGSIHSGHGGTYSDPGGGWFGEVGVAWLKWQLEGDQQSAKYFVGADCALCTNPIWEVDRKNIN